MRELIAVVGCHRSGTSCIAGGLKCLGTDLGPSSQLMPPSPENPAGYFESLPVVSAHDRLLRRYGGSWDAPPTPTGSAPMSTAVGQLADVLSAYTGNVAVVKDPRMTLFPLVWQQVANHAAVKRALRPILVYRDKGAIERSLVKRDGMTPERAAWLREHYQRYMGAWQQFPSSVLLKYETVLEQPRMLWELVRDAVDGLRFVDSRRLDLLEAFVNPELNHNG